MSYLTEPFGNNIYDFNKYIRSIGTDICEYGEDPGNLLLKIFATCCSINNGPFKRYIEMLENKYNDGTLKLESKDLMDKSKVKYNELKDKLKFKGK